MLLRYWPKKTSFSFMKYHWPAFLLSVTLVIVSLFFIFTKGLNLGIDFKGGSVIEIEKPADIDDDDIRSVIEPLGLGDVSITEARGTGLNAPTVIVIRVETQDAGDLGVEKAQQAATDLVENTLRETFPGVVLLERSTVGPKVSGELFKKGLEALGAALVLMLIYIWFRFEWQFSAGAVLALVHDVILTLGMFSALQFEFNLSTIAALLTIVGYSMNDTVVVFDRVREEMRKYKKMPLREVIDLALNLTLSRTTLTSLTTLLALFSIFFLGGSVLRGMSFALIWGVIIGTYSSVFVASSLLMAIGVAREKKAVEAPPGFETNS